MKGIINNIIFGIFINKALHNYSLSYTNIDPELVLHFIFSRDRKCPIYTMFFASLSPDIMLTPPISQQIT